jgi:hypothetical protein
MSGENLKNGITSAQRLRHDLAIIGYFLSQVLGERLQSERSRFRLRSQVNGFNGGGNGLAVFVQDEPERVANHVDGAQLDFGHGEHSGDGVGKAGDPVNGGKEDVLYPRSLSSFMMPSAWLCPCEDDAN